MAKNISLISNAAIAVLMGGVAIIDLDVMKAARDALLLDSAMALFCAVLAAASVVARGRLRYLPVLADMAILVVVMGGAMNLAQKWTSTSDESSQTVAAAAILLAAVVVLSSVAYFATGRERN